MKRKWLLPIWFALCLADLLWWGLLTFRTGSHEPGIGMVILLIVLTFPVGILVAGAFSVLSILSIDTALGALWQQHWVLAQVLTWAVFVAIGYIQWSIILKKYSTG